MSTKRPVQPEDVRGASRVLIDAIVGITDVVEAMHANIAHLPGTPRSAAPERARGISGLAYAGVRAVTGGVGRAIDAALSRLGPVLGAAGSTASREAVLAAVNGVLGDYLQETGNPLAIPMRLRQNGRVLDLDEDLGAGLAGQDGAGPGPRLLVLVHGLCRNDLQWRGRGTDHGAVLARDLGHTALYVHYNSGRHISDNGRDLAALLESLLDRWPVPLESLTIVAHSMGGLVSRSAVHQAAEASMRWPEYLRDVVFIATPHHGAPLERGGNWLQRVLGVTPYAGPLARLAKFRSAGITDLRHGHLVPEDWGDRDRFEGGGDRRRVVPLPGAVRCFAIAGTWGRQGLSARLLGDGLVPTDSALGRHREARRDLALPESRRWIADGVGHVDLATRDEVWQRIRDWVSAESGPPQKVITDCR